MRMLATLVALVLGAEIASADVRPVPRDCPRQVGPGVACFAARDANGAFVLIARPEQWNGALVVHTHGGPRMVPPRETTSEEDLVRFVETVREGYAWVATSRRRGGFGVAQGAEDAENARRIYVAAFGQPRLTFAHGQSWGANVAAILIEQHNAPGPDGRRPYDGALLTAGVLVGGTRGYDHRMDLLAAFHALCGVFPRDAQAFHPGLGLPAGVRFDREALQSHFNACTGADRAAEERTPEQVRAGRDLAAAARIPLPALFGHLAPAAQVFQDIAATITNGRSPFGNERVRYQGTSDDAAFNARVPRFAPDPEAVRLLAADSDPTGRIDIPVLSMHAIADATVFVEQQAVYRRTVEAAGNGARLVQVFVDDREHSKLSPRIIPPCSGRCAHGSRRTSRRSPPPCRRSARRRAPAIRAIVASGRTSRRVHGRRGSIREADGQRGAGAGAGGAAAGGVD